MRSSVFLKLLLIGSAQGFHSFSTVHHDMIPPSLLELNLKARWGSRADSNKDDGSGVNQVMSSMQSFKSNQKLGGLTSSLLQELNSVTIEGRSEDGKARVVMNGQQYPISCQLADDTDVKTLSTAVVQAMQDAHAKSLALMESKMKTLYDDIGLPSPNAKK
mmetsp:Transcript_18132/g.27449  ORF Transcript_18132/g.27449 Transcript_18132/m.27449 type:complete len:161 (-) Transcript_18132:1096-1578(-)